MKFTLNRNRSQTAGRKTSSVASLVMTGLFLSLFLVSGLVSIGLGIQKLLQGAALTSEEVLAALIVGSLFTVVSLAFYGALLYGHRKTKQGDTLRERHPHEPWRWNKKWASGRIASSSTTSMIVLWLFAAVFSIFSVPLAIKIPGVVKEEGAAAVIFIALFPLISLALLASAVRATLVHVKYGQSYCELVTNPGVIGGWFRGVIHTRLQPAPHEEIAAQFSCIRKYTTGSGKNRSTHEDVKWQEQMRIPGERTVPAPKAGALIPIEFYIPRDCRAATLDNSNDRILWRLDVTADVPGVDYKATFEVPVFVTPDSTSEPPKKAPAYALTQEDVADYARRSKIRVQEAAGRIEIYAPPARNPGVAAVITVFTAVWTGVVVFLFSVHAPLFMIVFGLFDLLLIWITVSMWFGSTRTIIRQDRVEITHRILGIGSKKTLTKDQIERVEFDIGMQSGNNAYYRVRIHLPNKKSYNVAGGIRDKNEARWLTSIVETALESN